MLPSTLFRRSTSTSSWSALFESDRFDLVDLSSKDDSSPSPSPSLDAPVPVPVPPSPPGDADASDVCVRGEGMGGALYPAGL